METAKKYNDIGFFIVFIAFASAFNYYLTYNNIQFNGFLLLTYVLDTVQGLIAWFAVRRIVIWLDRKMPYAENPGKRIGVQLLLTCFTGLSIISVLTETCALIIRGRMAPLNFYTFDMFIILIWFLAMNGIYIGMHYHHEWQLSETQRLADKKLKASGFYIKLGKQDLLVPFEDIMGFYSDDGFTYLHTLQGKTQLCEGSLDKAEQSVPEEYFFRLNRKYLIHRQSITGFKRLEDGKLEVNAKPFGNIPETIPVSRIRAVQFKKWFLLHTN
jgi:DNA-binding LytR/AlgR family response regulator